jgi:hypothetical protein
MSWLMIILTEKDELVYNISLDNAWAIKYAVIMNKLTTEKRVQIVAALVEGNSVRATCRMTGVAKALCVNNDETPPLC